MTQRTDHSNETATDAARPGLPVHGGVVNETDSCRWEATDGESMQRVEESIEVLRPLREVYDQWTRFEDFPRFVPGLKEVRQLDDTHVHWRAESRGAETQGDAEITEQEPDKRISWKSVSGAPTAGTVRFDALTADRTRVRLAMAYAGEGAAGHMTAQVQQAASRFKSYVESRAEPSRGWRGEVDHSVSQGQPL